MQKSKKVTIILLIGLVLFFLFCQYILVKLGGLYFYILKPICFVGVVLIISVLISSQIVIHKRRNDIVQYCLITVLTYMVIYLVSGIFPGFGKNPYDTSLKGIFVNVFSNLPVIISLEIMRYKLVNNVVKKDRTIIFILVVIVFSIWDLNFKSLLSGKIVPYTIFTLIFYNLIPIVVENILFTYIAQNGDYIPNILYRGIYSMFLWTLPILPKLPWVFEAILSTILPFFLLLYIRYFVNSKNKIYTYVNRYEENPKGLIPFSIVLVTIIWFTLGAFPIKPVGVATGSMYPVINVGDMVVMKSIKIGDIKEDDIVGYKLKDTTVVHRVKEIINDKGDLKLITKGDNNRAEDADPVTEGQIVGKVIFKVKYIAFPTIWLHSLYSGREDVGVETGK